MKELSLQEIQKIEFDILKMFDTFCSKNNIRYYLSNGTLLGSVKYKKFIFWDDDIDLLIPRSDYNRMLSLFKDTEKYHLFAFEKDENYLYPFAKLCDMTTRKIEFGQNNGVELGVDIDVFPLDAWSDDFEKAKKEVKYIRRNMRYLVFSKLKKPDSKNLLKRFVKRIVIAYCKMRGSKHFIKKIIKASSIICQPENKYLGCKSWCIYGEKEIIPADVFADTVEVEFEGEKFPAPIGYDKYLRNLYGAYEQDPPIEKQKTHHSFKAYKL